MNKQLYPSRQPAYVRLINSLGRQLASAGVVVPELCSERLLRHAKKRTGLHDFGDESFRDGLETLVTALHEDAQLSQVGQIVAYFNLLDHLSVRLQMVDYRASRPEIGQRQIGRPLFILGLPRTGTTILYELMAQDPSLRSPATWEVARPLPPAREETYTSDRRIRSVHNLLAWSERLSPGFRRIHAIGATRPQECVYMLASHFISEQFGYMYNIPHYRDWSLQQDMTAAYRWHAHFLQHLQVDYAGERWLLKTPAHLAYLKYIFAQYPDASVIWTHRRPLDAIASFSSLVSTLRGGFSDTVEPLAAAQHELEHFSTMVTMGMEQRRALDQGQFLDVGFDAICADPIEVVAQVYRYFDMNLSRAAESRMRDYLQQNPRGRYGEHSYSPEEFGLKESRERILYAPYLSQYRKFLL